jgi:hypothetical protein
MKSTLLFILSSFILVHTALAQSDIAVIDINASSDQNNWVPEGLTTSLEVTIQNADSIAISAGDSVLITVQYGVFVADAWVTLNSGLDTMETYTHNFGSDKTITFNSSMDTATLIGMATHLSDTNLANNQFEETFFASTIVNNDWHAGPIKILKPSNLNFFDIDNGTNIPPQLSEIEVSLINNGTVNYLEGTLIQYEVYVNDDVRALDGTIAAGGVGNGEKSIRVISNQAVLPVIPDSVGTYQLCARTTVPNDLTQENNAACMIFKIIDEFDPEDPSNWPFATDEIEAEKARMFQSNGVLNIETHLSYSIEIIDLSGKIIRTEKQVGNYKMNMNNLSAGLYFARLIHEGSEPQTLKIFVH